MEKTDAVAQKWAAGDYAAVGDKFATVGRSLVDEVGVAGHPYRTRALHGQLAETLNVCGNAVDRGG